MADEITVRVDRAFDNLRKGEVFALDPEDQRMMALVGAGYLTEVSMERIGDPTDRQPRQTKGVGVAGLDDTATGTDLGQSENNTYQEGNEALEANARAQQSDERNKLADEEQKAAEQQQAAQDGDGEQADTQSRTRKSARSKASSESKQDAE